MLVNENISNDLWQASNVKVDVTTPWTKYTSVVKRDYPPGVVTIKPQEKYLAPILLDIKSQSTQDLDFFYRHEK